MLVFTLDLSGSTPRKRALFFFLSVLFCLMAILWKDGRVFKSKIQVWAGPRFLYRTHPEQAQAMCLSGLAEPYDDGEERHKPTIAVIILLQTPLESPVPNPNFGLQSYGGGQRTVFKERLGPKTEYKGLWTYQLKHPSRMPA